MLRSITTDKSMDSRLFFGCLKWAGANRIKPNARCLNLDYAEIATPLVTKLNSRRLANYFGKRLHSVSN